MSPAANSFTPPGVDPRDVLLAEAARLLRRELESFFDLCAVWDRAGSETGQAPRPRSLTDDDLEHIRPALGLVRKIELTCGRAEGAGPWWLNDILDGRRAP